MSFLAPKCNLYVLKGKAAGTWSWPFIPSITHIKCEWSYISTHTCTFMASSSKILL